MFQKAANTDRGLTTIQKQETSTKDFSDRTRDMEVESADLGMEQFTKESGVKIK